MDLAISNEKIRVHQNVHQSPLRSWTINTRWKIRKNITTPKKYLEMYKSLEYKLDFNHQRLLEISKDENYIPDTIKELGGYENVIS